MVNSEALKMYYNEKYTKEEVIELLVQEHDHNDFITKENMNLINQNSCLYDKCNMMENLIQSLSRAICKGE